MVWSQILGRKSKKDASTSFPPHSAAQPAVVRDSELYDLIVDMSFDAAIRYAAQHPEAARYEEGDSWETPLHAAVQMDPPVAVVQALLAANPAALHTPARKTGEFPLHMACRYNARVDVITALVAAQPAAARLETKWGNTAIVALWRTRQRQGDAAPGDKQPEDYTAQFWQKMHILLQAVARSRQSEFAKVQPQRQHVKNDDNNPRCKEEFHVLHAAVSLGALGCPTAVLCFALHQYSHQVSQRDDSGRLPLHLAVGPTSWSCQSKRRYKPRERETIQRLLQAYPAAAVVPVNVTKTKEHERLALHLALANRHEWYGGVRDLVTCTPAAVLVQADSVSGLLPFAMAASCKRESVVVVVDLNTVYHVLRYQPAALSVAREMYRRDAGPAHNKSMDCAVKNTESCNRANRKRFSTGVGICAVASLTTLIAVVVKYGMPQCSSDMSQ